MVQYPVHSCTDVTGFALLGHSFEMAQGSGCSIYIDVHAVPFHEEAYEMAEMGFVPAGAYRNREFAEPGVRAADTVSRAMQDILYDPQTSGGLLMALPAVCAKDCLAQLRAVCPRAAIIGHVTGRQEAAIYLK